MLVTFYKFSGEANLVDKSSVYDSDSISLNCALKENTSVTHPSILLSNSVIRNKITTYNYCYIKLLGRHYFIDDIVIEANNIIRFNLSVDVLMSYKDFLFGQKALITRNQYLSSEGFNGGFQPDKRMPMSNVFTIEKGDGYAIFNPPLQGGEYTGWYCLTYFNTSEVFVPTSNLGGNIIPSARVNPYRTVSHTVLIKSDCSKGDNQLLAKILKPIISNTNVGSFVSSIYCIPFNGVGYGNGPYLNSLKIGDTLIEFTSNRDEYVQELYHPTKNSRRIFSWDIGNYADLPPYSEYKMYLPFIGCVDIPIEAYNPNNGKIEIMFESVFDFTMGNITYRLLYNSDINGGEEDIVFYETSVECMIPVPVSVSNAENVNRSKDAYTASYMGQAVGTAIAGGVASIVTMNPVPAIMALGGVTASNIKYPFEMKTMTPTATVQKASSIYGSFNYVYYNDLSNYVVNPKAFIIKYYRRAMLFTNDYYRLNGHACYLIKQLNEVHGYTEIGDIHLEIPSILSSESDMLMSLLTSGVIFPEPTT